ncbi:Spermidine synthase [invertebrate metagenome]|uniref:Spermidine synthase n=1 Tax=invertebrate metagenome TaxID=1711999 RepID=A0A484H6M5_9ZZZZ
MIRFEETLYPHWSQTFRAQKVLYHERSELQDLAIFESAIFGRILALDGVIQTTEADEHHYHEMMIHVPLLAHGAVQAVCVVGGGDGGALREVLKHPGVHATLVEIDPAVIAISRRYLPAISVGSFDDPRVTIIIADGVRYMADSGPLFDVIIIDSTDPQGPGEGLFQESFYASCRRRLKPGGILVTQNGVPFLQPDEVYRTYCQLQPHFADVWFFTAAVPTYVGGLMAMGWGSLDPAHRLRPQELIRTRAAKVDLETRYYTPNIHVASFALPRYIERLLL